MSESSETRATPDRVEPPSVENLTEARRAIEAMLLVASDPTPVQLLAQLVELPVDVVQAMCRELAAEYETERRGFMLAEVAGGWRYQTHPDTHAYVERFAMEGVPNRLSTAALETLAIVAYKQPISRGQIGAIRGVNVDGVLRTLVQRGYVDERGRDDGPGQATLFGTTQYFLEQLGLMSLGDLPPLGDFVPSAEVLEALEQTLKVGPDEIDLTIDEVEVEVEAGVGVEVEVEGEAEGAVEAEGEAAPGDPSDEAAPPGSAVERNGHVEDALVFEVVNEAVDLVESPAAAANGSADPANREDPVDEQIAPGAEADTDTDTIGEGGVEPVADDDGAVDDGEVGLTDPPDVEEPVVSGWSMSTWSLGEPAEAEVVEPVDETDVVEERAVEDPAVDVVEDPIVEERAVEDPVVGSDLGEQVDDDIEEPEDDVDSDDRSGDMEVAAESRVDLAQETDAIGAVGVDDAVRFRRAGDAAPPGEAPGGAVEGPHADHELGDRSQGPSAEQGWVARPLNGHGPTGNGNGHRPHPETGDA